MSLWQTVGVILLVLVAYGFILVACENKIIYHPYRYPEGDWQPSSYGVSVEDVDFHASDGILLHGWFVKSRDARATLLWFHGNAGNLTHRLDNIKRLEPLKLNIFIFDYRGYGKSEGVPQEEGIYLDSQAAYDTLVRDKKISPDDLILFGRSIGGIFAVDVASRNPAAALILESVFTSAKDMARSIFPFNLLSPVIRSKLDAVSKVPHLKLPKLFLHGDRDEVVPYRLGRKLFEAAAEPKEFYDIKGAGHNDTYIVGGKPYINAIDRFITKLAGDKKE